MASFIWMLVGVILLGMLVAGFVMGIIALTRKTETDTTLLEPVLVHPGAKNPSSAPTTVVVTSGTGFGTVTMAAGSSDTSGGVNAILAASAGSVTVTFGTPYAVAPKAVVLTATDASPTYTAALSVVSLSATGFTVRGTPGSPTSLSSTVFYYMVL